MRRFSWGKVIERFDYDFDGVNLNVVKYHPWQREGLNILSVHDAEKILYHCEELHESHGSIDALLISWMVRKNLGINQYALMTGICRALNIKNFE
jgi:hypothetical protein